MIFFIFFALTYDVFGFRDLLTPLRCVVSPNWSYDWISLVTLTTATSGTTVAWSTTSAECRGKTAASDTTAAEGPSQKLPKLWAGHDVSPWIVHVRILHYEGRTLADAVSLPTFRRAVKDGWKMGLKMAQASKMRLQRARRWGSKWLKGSSRIG